MKRALPLILTLPLLLGGCLQVEMTVQMREDGGATVTERVRFSKWLLELDINTPKDKQLVRLLERPAVDKRVKHMGAGVKVVSYKKTALQDGSHESVTVYSIPKIENLRLLNPYLPDAKPGRMMRLTFSPIYRRVHSYHRVGDLMMALRPAVKPKRGPRRPKDWVPPPPPAPVELQALRELEPMFADLMKDFQVTLRLICTKQPAGAIRNRQAGSKIITLMSFSDKDLDAGGRQWVDNEELMLSMLRFRLFAENITAHVRGFAGNNTLPVLRGRPIYGSGRFRIRPTKALFKKFYAGRPKSQGGDQPG
jgi:hypothetical protein